MNGRDIAIRGTVEHVLADRVMVKIWNGHSYEFVAVPPEETALHVSPAKECALEELNLWMADHAIPEEERDWLLSWAVRRAANMIDFLAEPMQEIAEMTRDENAEGSLRWRNPFEMARFVARQALKVCALPRAKRKDQT